MEFKPITENDLPEILELFNRNFRYDYPTLALLNEKIFAEPFLIEDGRLKLIKEGDLKGFLVLTVREVSGIKYGWIKLFCIDELSCNLKDAQKALEFAEEKLLEQQIDAIRIFDSFPNYLWSGIDPRYTDYYSLFYYNGYEYYHDNVNLEVDLKKGSFSTFEEEKELFENQGILIRRAEKSDIDSINSFIMDFFPNWDYEVKNMFKHFPATLHIALEGEEIIAFSGHNGNNFGTGWFGPMGTRPDKRGLGLGGILLKRCLQDMKEEELARSVIPWVGPIGFYHRTVNAYVSRIFWQMRKIINKDKFRA